jgi:hypothetical protein
MSDGPDRPRILDSVRTGKMTPAQAEIWARANGREPFAKRPDVSAHDPMKEELWTLPMAAAWFIWHSPHAVRDQWNLARKSWTKWIPLTDRLHKAPPRPNRRVWDLKLFRRANLDDVFAQTGLHPWNNSQKTSQFGFGRRSVGRRPFMGSPDRNPYHRFKVALQSGKLIATHMRPGEQEGAQIPAEYWIAEFEEFEDPLGVDLPGSPSAHDRRATPSEEPFESAFAVDLSDMLDRESNNWEIPESLFDDPPEGNFYVFRERVIEAEKEVSQRECGRPDWGLEQALGWLAYRNVIDFRSLGRAELNPPTYYGENYPPDFPNPQPVEALREALIGGVLKGYRPGGEVAQTEWLHMAVWDAPDVKFRRDDVLRIETDSKAQPRVTNGLPPEGASVLAPGNNFDLPRAPIDDAVAKVGHQRGGPKFERAKRAIDDLWPGPAGVPDQATLGNKALCKTVSDKVNKPAPDHMDNVKYDTILRAAGRRK